MNRCLPTPILARPPIMHHAAGVFSFEGREWEVVTEAAKDMISQMLVMDITRRATAKQLLQHRWFQVAATAPAAALGAHMVKRLRAFAGMSRMKRLALVVLARTLTDNDVKRLRVRGGRRAACGAARTQHGALGSCREWV